MKQGPKGYGEYCYNILQRTLENECRRQPPTIVELEVTINEINKLFNFAFFFYTYI